MELIFIFASAEVIYFGLAKVSVLSRQGHWKLEEYLLLQVLFAKYHHWEWSSSHNLSFLQALQSLPSS
jgi:hypothetical protein